MENLKNLLDRDENVLWKREVIRDIVPDKKKIKIIKASKIIFPIFIGVIILLNLLVLMTTSSPLMGSIFLIFSPLMLLCPVLNFRMQVHNSFNQQIELHEIMRKYYPDEILSKVPFLEVITNKHFIMTEPFSHEIYPLWLGVDIAHEYEPRNEFIFYNLDKLTDICKYIKPKKDRYEIGLYFDLKEHNLIGDDAPHYWFEGLTNLQYKNILSALLKTTPDVPISFLFKNQEDFEHL